MKKLILLFSVLLITFTSEAKKIKGQIILANDTLNVTLLIPFKFFSSNPNYEQLQYKIKYLNTKGEKETKKAEEVVEVRFTANNQKNRMISLPNTIGSSASLFSNRDFILLKLEKEGYCRMFAYYYTTSSPGMYNAGTGSYMAGGSSTVTQHFLQKGKGELTQIKGISFKRDMSEYFNDCPSLSEKIESKELRKSDINFIIDFYNKNCRE